MQRSGLIDESHPDSYASSSERREPVLSSDQLSSLTKLSLNEQAPDNDLVSYLRSQETGDADQESGGRVSSLDSHGLADYTFIWEHPAEEVFVTGSFDDWQKTVKLEYREGIFQKDVSLPKAHTFYKFVVDGHWLVDPKERTVAKDDGLLNNLLLPEDFRNRRWAVIRAKAAKRAARRQAGSQDEDHEDHEAPTSRDESMESRVARIKARVVELTRDNVGQPPRSEAISTTADATADKERDSMLTRGQRLFAVDNYTAERDISHMEAKQDPGGHHGDDGQGNAPADDSSGQKAGANTSNKDLHDLETALDTSTAKPLGIRHSPIPKDYLLLPSGGITTPPDSSSGDELGARSLNRSPLRELSEALQLIDDKRVTSPTRQTMPLEDSVSGRKSSIALIDALDYILSDLGDAKAREAFSSHEISGLWVPLPKQTVRRLFTDSQSERWFMQLQDNLLDLNIRSLDNYFLNEAESGSHLSLGDDEGLIEEHRVLGEGGCGIVEEVSFSTGQGRTRCVRKRIGRPKPLKAQKKIMAAFAREIGVMRQVDHQHCVRFLASYTDFDHVNILSLPVADMDLATFLDRPVQQPERKLLYRGFGCLSNAINYLHQNNIRHEDLKPQNVLIHGDNILLTDFGFSLDFSDDSASTTTGNPSAWTIRYSAPEVLNCEPRNRATDIWSLGCIFVEMVSGFHGIRLSDLKERWKRTGNGQASFARNNEALEAWFRDTLEDFDDPKITPVMRRLCLLTHMMLSKYRLQRPSAQHVIDNISDMAQLTNDYSEQYGATCQGPEPCTGLSCPAIMMDAVTLQATNPQRFHYLDEYLHPWCYDRWRYRFGDLEWTDIPMPDCDPDPDLSQLLVDNKDRIHAACVKLYSEASKTGATKSFWSAHVHSSKSLTSSEGTAHMLSSAVLLNLKNVVFTRLFLHQQVTDSGVESPPCSVQVTLIPICHPRSPFYGSFFWMLSWSTDYHDGEDIEYECIDLTDMNC